MFCFDLKKYLGTWYELLHYPSRFQRNDSYNSMAQYSLLDDGTIQVHNSTVVQGQRFDVVGIAKFMGGTNFRVDFPQESQDSSRFLNLPQLQEDNPQYPCNPKETFQDDDGINYVIDKVWTNCTDQYIFAVVTNPERNQLFVLSRYPNPSFAAYTQIMKYVSANYDRDLLIAVPHFH